MNRRSFVAAAAGAALTRPGSAAASKIPVIDTHIHLFDTNRPQGVPWPDKKNTALYKPALPDRYRKLAVPVGVVGAIEVEASPLLEDNQWVLDVCAKDTIMVGTVGDLEPGKPDFAKNLARFHKNPLYRGIRYGNLWGRNMTEELKKPAFINDLKLLAEADLTLDSANPNPALLTDLLQVSDKVPNLRIVIDHLPQMKVPEDAAGRKSYESNLKQIGARKQIYVKISEVYRRENGTIPRELSHYRGTLDQLFGVFGEDRVLYGSDWPNSDNWLPYQDVFSLVHEYFMSKGQSVAEKYFWRNSVKAYKWVKRDPSQPTA